MLKTKSYTDIRIQVSSYRYQRLQLLARLLAQPELEIIKLAIDDYFSKIVAARGLTHEVPEK